MHQSFIVCVNSDLNHSNLVIVNALVIRWTILHKMHFGVFFAIYRMVLHIAQVVIYRTVLHITHFGVFH